MNENSDQLNNDTLVQKKVFGGFGGGRKPTSGLFKENGGDTYCLREFRIAYHNSADPSGFLCASIMLTEVPEEDRWEEWKRLLTNGPFAKEVDKWRDELEIAIRAKAISSIAKGCDPKDFPRLKALAKGEIVGTPRIGRPTKVETEKKERQAKQIRGANPDAFDLVKNRIGV